MRLIAIAALLFTSISAAQAATITLNDLPAAVQNCYASGSCFVDMDSAADFQGMSAHRYYDYDLNTGTLFDGWMIRYSLAAPSGNVSASYFDPVVGELQSLGTMVTPYSGNVWLQASNSYNLADPYHQFTLFTDTVAPLPQNFYNFPADSNVINLGLTTSDLLAGGAFVFMSGYPDYLMTGSLQRFMFSCVECTWRTEINLVFLDYSTGTLSFNPGDQRSLLLGQGDKDFLSGSYSIDQLYVQAVPLPAAFPLLCTGLALLGVSGLRRRKKN